MPLPEAALDVWYAAGVAGIATEASLSGLHDTQRGSTTTHADVTVRWQLMIHDVRVISNPSKDVNNACISASPLIGASSEPHP